MAWLDLQPEVIPGHIFVNLDPLSLVLNRKEQLYGSKS